MMITTLASHFLAVRRWRLFAITIMFLGLTFCVSRPSGTLLLVAFAAAAAIAHQLRSMFQEFTDKNEYLHMLPVSPRALYLSQLLAALIVGGALLALYWGIAVTGALEALSAQLIPDHRYELFFTKDVAWVIVTALAVYVAAIHLGHARTLSGFASAPAICLAVRFLTLPQAAEWLVPIAVTGSTLFAIPPTGAPTEKRTPTLWLGTLICLPGVLGIFFFLAGTLNAFLGTIVPMPRTLTWLPLLAYLMIAAVLTYRDSVRRGMGRAASARWSVGAFLLIGQTIMEVKRRGAESAMGTCSNCGRKRLCRLENCPFCGTAEDALPVDDNRSLRRILVAGIFLAFALQLPYKLTGSVPLLCRLASEETVLQQRLNNVRLTVFSSPFFEINADQAAERHTWNRLTLRSPRVSELDTAPEEFLKNPYACLSYGHDVKATFHARGLVSGRTWSGPLKASDRFRSSHTVDSLTRRQTTLTVEIDIPDAHKERQLFREQLESRDGLDAKVAYLRTLGPAAPYLVAVTLPDRPADVEAMLLLYYERECNVDKLSGFAAYREMRAVLSSGELPGVPRLPADDRQLGPDVTPRDSVDIIQITTSPSRDSSPLNGCRYATAKPSPVTLFAKALLKNGHGPAVEQAYRRAHTVTGRELRLEVLSLLRQAYPERAALFTRPDHQTVYSALAIGRNADPGVLSRVRRTYNGRLREYEKAMAAFEAAEANPRGFTGSMSYSFGPLLFLGEALLATESSENITLAARSFPRDLVPVMEKNAGGIKLDFLEALNNCNDDTIRLFLGEVPNIHWPALNLERYPRVESIANAQPAGNS